MSFENILGHSKEISILKKAILGGKVAHSYLFSGPDGVGKKLAAFELSRALNCVNFNGDSCGRCANCELMERRVHPNLLLVYPTDKDGAEDANGLIRIDRVREIQNTLKFKADGKKVVIVDRADRMQPAAANAFLKTLEEPPADSVIILVSSHATELLPTILSRCQKINFRPLSEDLIAGFLTGRKGLSGDQAATVARLSLGSVSEAVKYSTGWTDEKRKEFLERLIRLSPGDTDLALKFAEDLSKSDDLDEILELIKVWYRDKAIFMEGAGHLAVNAGMAARLENGKTSSFRELWDSFSMVEAARRDIMPPRYANKQLTMEALLLRLIENA